MLTRAERRNVRIFSEAYTSITRTITATTEHWFQDATYSLSPGRLRVKLALAYRDFRPLMYDIHANACAHSQSHVVRHRVSVHHHLASVHRPAPVGRWEVRSSGRFLGG